MTHRVSLFTLVILALLAWGGLLLYTRFVAPDSFFAFAAFFALLIVALTCTLTPVTYAIGSRLINVYHYRATIKYALRQALLLSLAIELNLLLRALHSWNIIVGIVLFIAAIIVEILLLARK